MEKIGKGAKAEMIWGKFLQPFVLQPFVYNHFNKTEQQNQHTLSQQH